MLRRWLLGGSFLALTVPSWAADTWLLVTPEEVSRDLAAPRLPEERTRGWPQPGAPEILVSQPTATGVLHAPLSFRVSFKPQPGADINAQTFRATYGALGIDITSRLLQHARLTQRELAADNVAIPAGSHKVTLMIADNQGRENRRTFQFTVE